MKAYQFEIYTCNPTTKESGWDIQFRTVLANNIKEAEEELEISPLFDCIIAFNNAI